jgi:hypothetical protein
MLRTAAIGDGRAARVSIWEKINRKWEELGPVFVVELL